MAETTIEWCHFPGYVGKTWNPTRGCSRISPGCGGAKGVGGCYAERQAARFAGPGGAYEGLVQITKQGARWTGKVPVIHEKLAEPLGWRRRSAVFVNSMSDLFHESLSDDEIDEVLGIMAVAEQHIFIVLTKRATRMREYFAVDRRRSWGRAAGRLCENGDLIADQVRFGLPVLPNLVLGVSVETQAYADIRIPDLLATPAACRMVSYEPALGPVDFERIALEGCWFKNALTGTYDVGSPGSLLVNPNRLDWVVVGGESGPGARPFDVEWARRTVRDCRAAGVPVFVKQLGALPVVDLKPTGDFRTHEGRRQFAMSASRVVLRARKGDDMAEWPEDLRVREFPAIAASGAS